MTADLDGIFTCLKSYYLTADPDVLIKTALSFTFSKDLLKKIDKEYETSPDPEIHKYCIMWG